MGQRTFFSKTDLDEILVSHFSILILDVLNTIEARKFGIFRSFLLGLIILP